MYREDALQPLFPFKCNTSMPLFKYNRNLKMDVSLVSYKKSEEYKTKSVSEEYKMYKSSEEYQHEFKATVASQECVSRQS